MGRRCSMEGKEGWMGIDGDLGMKLLIIALPSTTT